MMLMETPVYPATDDDQLLQLHLEIAHRADQLAQSYPRPPDRDADLECWLEAEREILAAHDVRGQ